MDISHVLPQAFQKGVARDNTVLLSSILVIGSVDFREEKRTALEQVKHPCSVHLASLISSVHLF